MGSACTKAKDSDKQNADIRDTFRIGKLLGAGAFGQVRECTNRKDRSVYAVKIMEKRSSERGHWSNENMFQRETALLATISHPNIIKYYEVYEDKHFLYAVMEKCDGGELFEAILRLKTFKERHAAILCFQMLKALEYLHGMSIVHRDVKAENFLFETESFDSPLKLIDFGMSAKLEENQILSDVCGSPHYLSPELIRRKYNYKADIWALGVLMYLMLYGQYPFDGSSTNLIVKEILTRKIDWNANGIRPSDKAINFVKSLLQRDADKRPTATEATQHIWLIGAKRKWDIEQAKLARQISPAAVTTTAAETAAAKTEDEGRSISNGSKMSPRGKEDRIAKSPKVDEIVESERDLLDPVRAAYQTIKDRKQEIPLERKLTLEKKIAEMNELWLRGKSHGVRISPLNRPHLPPEFTRRKQRVSGTASGRIEHEDLEELERDREAYKLRAGSFRWRTDANASTTSRPEMRRMVYTVDVDQFYSESEGEPEKEVKTEKVLQTMDAPIAAAGDELIRSPAILVIEGAQLDKLDSMVIRDHAE